MQTTIGKTLTTSKKTKRLSFRLKPGEEAVPDDPVFPSRDARPDSDLSGWARGKEGQAGGRRGAAGGIAQRGRGLRRRADGHRGGRAELSLSEHPQPPGARSHAPQRPGRSGARPDEQLEQMPCPTRCIRSARANSAATRPRQTSPRRAKFKAARRVHGRRRPGPVRLSLAQDHARQGRPHCRAHLFRRRAVSRPVHLGRAPHEVGQRRRAERIGHEVAAGALEERSLAPDPADDRYQFAWTIARR